MAWTYRAGPRRLDFTDATDGVGLLGFPEIGTDGAADVFAVPRRDGRRFGRDLVEGQTVSLQVEVRPDERPLDEVWREVVAAWRGDEVRGTPGMLASLTADSGRSVRGRPRPVSADSAHRLFDVMRAELVFECVDDLWYGPAVSTRVYFSVPETGGLTFPAVAPFTFDSGPTQRNGVLVVDGDVATFPTFAIRGPVTNPTVYVAGHGTLMFETVLAFDQTLTVNTRDGWVKRNGAALPGALSPRGARLSDMRLSPGSYEVVLGGYDPTGTGYLDVQVEPAFTSF